MGRLIFVRAIVNLTSLAIFAITAVDAKATPVGRSVAATFVVSATSLDQPVGLLCTYVHGGAQGEPDCSLASSDLSAFVPGSLALLGKIESLNGGLRFERHRLVESRFGRDHGFFHQGMYVGRNGTTVYGRIQRDGDGFFYAFPTKNGAYRLALKGPITYETMFGELAASGDAVEFEGFVNENGTSLSLTRIIHIDRQHRRTVISGMLHDGPVQDDGGATLYVPGPNGRRYEFRSAHGQRPPTLLGQGVLAVFRSEADSSGDRLESLRLSEAIEGDDKCSAYLSQSPLSRVDLKF